MHVLRGRYSLLFECSLLPTLVVLSVVVLIWSFVYMLICLSASEHADMLSYGTNQPAWSFDHRGIAGDYSSDPSSGSPGYGQTCDGPTATCPSPSDGFTEHPIYASSVKICVKEQKTHDDLGAHLSYGSCGYVCSGSCKSAHRIRFTLRQSVERPPISILRTLNFN